MPESLFGAPQIVAVLILIQRGAEEVYSQINTRRALKAGAYEAGRDYYPVVALSHLGWIAAIYFLIPSGAPIFWPAAVVYLLLQVARYWIIGTLGPYWTHRIIVREQGPVVRKGPYRFVRHPNYVVVIAETAILPMVFGQYAMGIILGVIIGSVILYKQRLEERTLAERRAGAVAVEATAP